VGRFKRSTGVKFPASSGENTTSQEKRMAHHHRNRVPGGGHFFTVKLLNGQSRLGVE
jgi:hypothetical protein